MDKLIMCQRLPIKHKAVAFTFDDGPNPVFTREILQILQEVSAKSTFFMIGEHMVKYPEVVQAVVEQDHEIGNHTFSHPMLPELSYEECLKEITETDNIIFEMTGKRPLTFRPPYLQYNDVTKSVISGMGYHVIGAVNLDAKDWEQPGVNHIVTSSLKHVQNGAIFLFHDGFDDRSQTVEAVRKLAYNLTEEGYRIVTVSDLLRIPEEL